MPFFKPFVLLALTFALAACSRGPAVESYDDLPLTTLKTSSSPKQRIAGAPALVFDEMHTASYWGQGQAASDSACVRLNNYWCIKTPYSSYWEGQTGRDEREHAIFSHPAYGARAFARLMRAYHFKHGLDTPVAIISRYAPSNDCKGWANFHCPEKVSSYAKTVADGLGIAPNQSIGLFNADGTMNESRAIDLFRIFAKVEIGGGFVVPEPLIRRGIELEQTAYLSKYGSLTAGPMAVRPLPQRGGLMGRWFSSNSSAPAQQTPASFEQSDLAAGYAPAPVPQAANTPSAPLPPFEQQASLQQAPVAATAAPTNSGPAVAAAQDPNALAGQPYGMSSDAAFQEFEAMGVSF